jgi:hypothetical protein
MVSYLVNLLEPEKAKAARAKARNAAKNAKTRRRKAA